MTITKKQGILLAIIAVIILCTLVLTILNYPPGIGQYGSYIGYTTFIVLGVFSIYLGWQRMQVARKHGEKIVWYNQMQIVQGLAFLMLGLFEEATQFIGPRLPYVQRHTFFLIGQVALGVLVLVFCIFMIRAYQVSQTGQPDQREQKHTEKIMKK